MEVTNVNENANEYRLPVFIRIDKFILENPNLNLSEEKIYAYIYGMYKSTGKFTASSTTLGKIARVHPNRIRTILNSLEKKGFVERDIKRNNKRYIIPLFYPPTDFIPPEDPQNPQEDEPDSYSYTEDYPAVLEAPYSQDDDNQENTPPPKRQGDASKKAPIL